VDQARLPSSPLIYFPPSTKFSGRVWRVSRTFLSPPTDAHFVSGILQFFRSPGAVSRPRRITALHPSRVYLKTLFLFFLAFPSSGMVLSVPFPLNHPIFRIFFLYVAVRRFLSPLVQAIFCPDLFSFLKWRMSRFRPVPFLLLRLPDVLRRFRVFRLSRALRSFFCGFSSLGRIWRAFFPPRFSFLA